jgi:hypothetical protein
LEALELEGGGIYNLARQSVAALLNICSDEVDYGYPGGEEGLIADVNAAYENGTAGEFAEELAALNNSNCPLEGTSATTANLSMETTEKTSEPIITDEPVTEQTLVEEEGFRSYPVPFRETLNIEYQFEYTSDVAIQLFNWHGQLVRTYKDAKASKGKVTILNSDFRVMPNQVYIVKLTTDRDTFVKRVISDK